MALRKKLARLRAEYAASGPPVNACGLTWSEWRRAARAPSFWDVGTDVEPYLAAWRAGVDPSEYAALSEVT